MSGITFIPSGGQGVITTDGDEVLVDPTDTIVFPDDSLTDNEDGSVGVSFPDTSGIGDLETLLSTYGKGKVNHGATASTARPAGFASVEWHGSVEPANAIAGDTWIVEE